MQALWMILASFWFALMAVGIKYASNSFGTFELIFYRGVVSVVFMAIVVSVQLGRGWLRHMAMTRPLLVLGNTTAVVVMLIAATAGVRAHLPAGSRAPPGAAASLWRWCRGRARDS